ncbi:hypothetical protein MSAN_00929500 [Mycena sanguinolenta]|uniref:Uncharacterized protein n=1 Tax=Mycena sanguinolenta TaxID=230812 RepID=A0A8H7D907_9AGAR|nr:hypothetical protein MSAN_00929500 [Mycena sanguinolenta]
MTPDLPADNHSHGQNTPKTHPERSSLSLQSVATHLSVSSSSTLTYAQQSEPHFSAAFVPITPQAFNRYERGRYIENVVTDYVVRPLSRSIHIALFDDWIPHEHPEGAIYFKHKHQNIYTDVDLYNPIDFRRLAFCQQEILQHPLAEDLLKSGSVDLVLDIVGHDKDHLTCAYYFIDHAERVVFWVHDFSMSQLHAWRRVPGITTATHAKMGLEVEYWRHSEYFPSALPISLGLLQELRSQIVFSITDAMTSPTTMVPLQTDYLLQMLRIIDAVATDIETMNGAQSSFTPIRTIDKPWGVVVGRFMGQFTLSRFQNFNGELFARLDRSNSVYGPVPEPSSRFILISRILFNSPATHLVSIQMMFKDGILNCLSWKEFMSGLRAEWQETILFGTLILNANVGFLAISSGTLTVEVLARTLSCISVFFGFGSVVTGLVLCRQYENEFKHPCSSSDTTAFFSRRSVIGLQSLAILYSLPSTFMLWGMTTFVMAFLTMTIQSITGAARGLVVVVFVGIFASAFGYLTAEIWIRCIRRKKALRQRWAEKFSDIFKV